MNSRRVIINSCVILILGLLSIDLYNPALPAIKMAFDISDAQAQFFVKIILTETAPLSPLLSGFIVLLPNLKFVIYSVVSVIQPLPEKPRLIFQQCESVRVEDVGKRSFVSTRPGNKILRSINQQVIICLE